MTVSRTILALSLALIGSQAAAADPYFRFPAVRGDTIVFTAEGDLWRTTTAGGKATRLTTHPSAETHAAISHDGKLLAFAASYEGAQEAYVMPLEGGLPKRITFENGGVTVLGWTVQGEVLVSTENSSGPAKHRVVAALDPGTMKRRVLPLADANDATLDDGGKVVYFTRMGLSMTNDNVRSYRGGAHAQLWRFDLDAKGEATQLFKGDMANNRRAMWHQGRLYFISDAGGADNIWSSLPDGSDRRAHTSHKEWDVRTASLGDGRIVYQLGADLQTADKQAAVAAAAAATASAANAANSDKPKKPTPAIVYAGLRERLYEVPVAPGNYRALAVDDKRLYLLDSDDGQKGVLKTLEISRSAPQPETFVSNVREFGLSADRKHVFYRTYAKGAPGDMLIVAASAKAPADLTKAKVKIDDWAVTTNPRLEWKQMFNDAWRMHRDFLYDAKMRGVDWNAARARYAPLVERVTDRAELDDVLGMMVGEVGALHSQIRPGDVRRATGEGTPSSLGAVLSRMAEGYRVDRVYRSEPELPSEAGPLSPPDVGVKEGDVILAVNGKSLREARDIADLLLDQADKQVLLQVKTPGAKPRQVIVTPVSMARHASLRYADWEQSRARQVDETSKGKIGYLHLRAMVARDINAFARDFYANINKEGLIIDVRRNNGGNIDSWIIEKLLRRSWAFWASNGNQPQSNMQNTFRGHLVVLADELTYSDGETFTAGVKALKLGPVVGKRTAGAGVWLSDGNGLTDNGMARVAEFGQFSSEGEWLIEGVGVAPDVEVDNLPHETFKGRDRQLEVALEMLEKKLKEQPVKAWKPAAIPALKRQE